MNRTPGISAEDDGAFDPRQAAALLDQASAQARRAFTPGTPALFAFRAILVLVVFGGFWLVVVAGAAGFAGPAGAWLGIGLSAVCQVVAAGAASRRRGVVRR